jgi:hypothetical protein
MTLYVIFSAVAFLILQKQSYTTKVNNPKTGESFRKQRKNLYIYDWIIKELKGDIQAQEIAKLERLDMLSQR